MPKIAIKAPETETPAFFPTGSTLLDLIHGGGWPIGRVVNVVGDRSSGKTLLAIEACANFARLFGVENILYDECEAAFSIEFAKTLGMPEGVKFVENDETGNGSSTVEEFYANLNDFLNSRTSGPCLYILDSLDALSDKAESEREIGAATYGTGKAKALSELFRRIIGKLEAKQCTLIVISQIRDKIGVTFGETKTRSGGRALDFYCSIIDWLSEIGKIKHTVTGVERTTGVKVKVQNKKNKMSIPFRMAEIEILFGYGTDNEASLVAWLKTNKLGGASLPNAMDSYVKAVEKARNTKNFDELDKLSQELKTAVQFRWEEIEEALRPSVLKYR